MAGHDHHNHAKDGRPARMLTLLGIDVAFFFLELGVGYTVHSLALIADSFHMLNDIISLLIALWALRLAKRRSTASYTYGWQRAEILGGLVNAVFLCALCLSIIVEAIQRLLDPPEIKKPMLVLGVGSAGLVSNIIGLFLFHGHGHSHGDSHEPSHGTPKDVETGSPQPIVEEPDDIAGLLPDTTIRKAAQSPQPIPTSSRHRGSAASRKRHFASPEDIRVHPAENRQELIHAATLSTPSSSAVSSSASEDESTPLIAGGRKRSDSSHLHRGHRHTKRRASRKHRDTNMHSVFLHVLGDALGNVGVILTALLIRFFPTWPLTRYADPFISLLISFVIMYTTAPLIKMAGGVLLQGTPAGICIEDVKADITAHPDVQGIHELHIWQLSDVKLIASVHIQIGFDRGGAGGEARYMSVASAVRTCLHEYGIHSVTIQVEYRPNGEGDGEYGSIGGEGGGKANGRCLLECAPHCEAGNQCCEDEADEEGTVS